MLRPVSRMSCVTLILLLGVASSRAQTLSSCLPAPPMPVNVKPGVVGLTLSRDGKTLVVAGGDGRIRVFEVATGKLEQILSGHTNVVYKANFDPSEKLLGSSSRDQTARIWDIATGRELQKLTGFRCPVKAVEFKPDGKLIAASGNDGMLKIWDVKTGAELQSLVHINSANVDMAVYSIAFSRNGKKIYGGNGDGTISEWDVASGKETRNWKAHENSAYKLLFSPDYRLLASFGDSVVKLWDTTTWREAQSFSMATPAGVTSHSGSIAFSNDGKLIAASDIGLDAKQNTYVYVQALVWNAKTGEKLYTLKGHKFDIDALVFTRDDRFLLTGSVDTTVKFWDMKTGGPVRTLTMPTVEMTNH
jgi:WD40 repeat protein